MGGRGSASRGGRHDGFSTKLTSDGHNLFDRSPTIYHGIPTYKEAKETPYRQSVYVMHPSELAGKKLYGIDTRGDDPRDSRTAKIVEAWKHGRSVPVVEIHVNQHNHYFIADGNHRVWAALLTGDRRIAVQFKPVTSKLTNMDPMSSAIKSFLRGKGK
jgi:hypothetical protein